MNPPKAERAKPSLSSDYNLLFKNKIGESSLDIHRYLASTVDAWTEWFNNHPDVVDKKLHDAQMSAMSELKKENARKDREIARKDKALADAATMLMLSKKAEAIWGAKES